MKRMVVALVVLALLLVSGVVTVLGAIGSDEEPGAEQQPAASLPPEPGSTVPPSRQLAPFYAQGVTWEPCRERFECATIEVPMDYAEPNGATIDLALLKVPAADLATRVGSLVVNPGGPGASGTDYASQSGLVFGDPLLNSFDIVGFDPRGTGESHPVDCLTDEQMDAYLASEPDPDTAAERREFAREVSTFGRACVERTGQLIGHVSTIEAARDMDVLRAALGESQLDYYGASYGTQLGSTYAELFPANVGRFVLDAAVDPTLGLRQDRLSQAGGFETALRSYVQNCLETAESCFLGDSVAEGMQRIQAFLESVDATPLQTSDGREVTEGVATTGIAVTLYNRDYWTLLSQGLTTAFDGDGTTLLLLADAYATRQPSGEYSTNLLEALYAINCLDDPSSVPFSQVESLVPAFERASPTFGRGFAWGLTGCSGFAPRSSLKPLRIRAEGAAPIVVVGTTRDPATPYAEAVALADQLESGVLVSRDGDGHGGYNVGNDCVDEAVESYLIRGDVPDDGLAC